MMDVRRVDSLEMVAFRWAHLVLITLMLSGCYDSTPGPGLQNALNADVELSIRYTDGKVLSHVWPAGDLFVVGRSDLSDDSIQEILVTESGKVIHRLNRNEVRVLVEKQTRYRTHAVWCVERDRIYLFEPNPTLTGGCSKGTLIEEFRNPAKPESRNTEVPVNDS